MTDSHFGTDPPSKRLLVVGDGHVGRTLSIGEVPRYVCC